jgi:hypothetical protein
MLTASLSWFSNNIKVSRITALETFHIPAVIVFIQEDITAASRAPPRSCCFSHFNPLFENHIFKGIAFLSLNNGHNLT